jgi:branched-chain amino acid transport system ATP-binding protein
MLAVNDLEVRYGPIRAVSGLSLKVGAGEVVGLIGRNGAGKTTTISAVTGLVRPQAGTITFAGESLVGKAPELIARRGLGLVPEGRRIFSTLTVAENLTVGGATLSGTALDEAVERVVDRFPVLRRYYSTPAGKLSGGEQQQLAIARALIPQPKLLLLDEPSLGLAPLLVDQVFDLLAELRASGQTILLVEQNAHRAIGFADRCYVLRSGRVDHEGDRTTLLASERVAQSYFGVASGE